FDPRRGLADFQRLGFAAADRRVVVFIAGVERRPEVLARGGERFFFGVRYQARAGQGHRADVFAARRGRARARPFVGFAFRFGFVDAVVPFSGRFRRRCPGHFRGAKGFAALADRAAVQLRFDPRRGLADFQRLGFAAADRRVVVFIAGV